MQSCHDCQISLLANEEESIYGRMDLPIQKMTVDNSKLFSQIAIAVSCLLISACATNRASVLDSADDMRAVTNAVKKRDKDGQRCGDNRYQHDP